MSEGEQDRDPGVLGAGSLLGFAIASSGQLVQHRFRTALEPYGLHPRAFGILLALEDGEGRSQQQLSRRLGIPASRVVALVDDLQAAGLVVREQHPTDRRVYALGLTAAGRERLEAAGAAALELEQQVLAGLAPEERDQLGDLLARVAANLGEGGVEQLRVW